MKRIAVITSTRAEFGLLMPVIKKLRTYETRDFMVELIVTGTHLKEEYGNTIEEIKKCNLRIDKQVEVPVNSANALDISMNQSVILNVFSKIFVEKRYEGIVILGDRYEMLAIAIAAGNTHTPIFHLCGGDTTEGAIDEWIRHSITKMSYLHFPTNAVSYRRVIQLGENPERVFNYGSTSIDNIIHSARLSKIDVLQSVGLMNCKYAIGTYHPVTMEENCISQMIEDFLNAIMKFPQIEFIITKSNADQGGAQINELLDKASINIRNLHVFSSLGIVRYLSLMKYAEFVLGNSSSGIIEAPIFRIPTVNIGDRQKGRLQADSIINCEADTTSISNAIRRALSKEFREICAGVKNPYGDGDAADKIAGKIVEVVKEGKISLKKKFYDLRI